MWKIVRALQPTLQKVTGARKIGIAVEGFGVPHVHIHLVPVNNGGELDPHRAIKATSDELQSMHILITKELSNQTLQLTAVIGFKLASLGASHAP
jgi:diadenosine tetraphosphate (Ap4A) HIT family hydrolase